jgi:hypothetical protein
MEKCMVRKIFIFVSKMAPQTILVTTAVRFPECRMYGGFQIKIDIQSEYVVLLVVCDGTQWCPQDLLIPELIETSLHALF